MAFMRKWLKPKMIYSDQHFQNYRYREIMSGQSLKKDPGLMVVSYLRRVLFGTEFLQVCAFLILKNESLVLPALWTSVW